MAANTAQNGTTKTTLSTSPSRIPSSLFPVMRWPTPSLHSHSEAAHVTSAAAVPATRWSRNGRRCATETAGSAAAGGGTLTAPLDALAGERVVQRLSECQRVVEELGEDDLG